MATLPPLDDPRLDLLVGVYAEAADRLRILLDQMMLAEGPRRHILYQRILEILRELRGQTDEWSQTFVTQFLQEADTEAVAALQAAGIARTLGDSIDPVAVESLVTSLTGSLQKATESVQLLAGRIFRNLAIESEFPELGFKARREVAVGLASSEATSKIRQKVAGLLREKFTDGLVSVLGSNGRRYEFSLNYYAGMVAQNTKAQARSVSTLKRAQEASHDLVRVTPNPSKGGDWCDAYRGRVFSISGTHPLYPPLSSLPNGGPPFHPWCKHGLGIHVSEFFSEEQNLEFAQVNPDFLLTPDRTVNDVVRNWWEAKSRNDNPSPLKFA